MKSDWAQAGDTGCLGPCWPLRIQCFNSHCDYAGPVTHSSLQVLASLLLNLFVRGVPAPTHAEECWALLRQYSCVLYNQGILASNLHGRAIV